MTKEEQLNIINDKIDYNKRLRYIYIYRNALKNCRDPESFIRNSLINIQKLRNKIYKALVYCINNDIHDELPWVFPDGRLKYYKEYDSEDDFINLIKEEVEENTKLSPDKYKLLNIKPVNITYKDGLIYSTDFYFAKADDNAKAYVDYKCESQTKNISKVEWLNYNELSNYKLDDITKIHVSENINKFIDIYNSK